MTKYNKVQTVRFTSEQVDRMEDAIANGEYTFKSDYVRSMVEAGESNIAALDPRTTETETAQAQHTNGEQAARAVTDATLIDQLGTGEEDGQKFDEVIEQLEQEFTNKLIDRLMELSEESTSPVKTDGRGNYWVSHD